MKTLTATEYFCLEIAIALGADWAIQYAETANSDIAYLVRNGDGLTLFCRDQGKHLYITPDSPEKGQDANHDRPAIKVRRDRLPETIAKDIHRRLLPDATTWWAKSQARQKEQKAAEQAIATFEAQMKQLTGTTKSPSSNNYYGNKWQCHQYHLATDLTFHGLTHAQTLALLRAYYDMQKES